jgi:hypothetical protein
MARSLTPATLLLALPLAAAGCTYPEAPPPAKPAAAQPHGHAEHDHADHDHPETLAEGIAQLAQAAADVEKHLAAGATDAADEVVHGIGHIIEDVQGLLPKENLTAEGRQAASKALDEFWECFDKLDTALHAPAGQGEPPAAVHGGVKERIEKALAALKAAR